MKVIIAGAGVGGQKLMRAHQTNSCQFRLECHSHPTE